MTRDWSQYVKGLPKKWIARSQIPKDKWFWYGTVWNGDIDGDGYAAKVYGFMVLCLPSWGDLYDIRLDEYRFGQRVLIWHGLEGFRMTARFPNG